MNHRGITRETKDAWMQVGFIQNQVKASGRIVHLTPEEMARHEAMIRIKMQESEDAFKNSERAKVRFFRKSEGVPIAVPVTDGGIK